MSLSYQRLCISAVLLILAVAATQVTSRKLQEVSMSERHEQWLLKYGKVYENAEEKERRFNIFKYNVEFIESFNAAENKPYKLSINEFADQTNDEFKASRNGYRRVNGMSSKKETPFRYENVAAVPATMDWRKKGAVTPIKNQGQCVKNHGINSEANYPYEAVDGTCNAKKEASHAAKITGYETVPANSESALLKAVAHQPISVSIDAGGSSFQFYSSGVFTGDCGTELDHGVTAVGYGTTSDGTKYWLVKNSWGTSWGEEGYIRMQRDIDAKEGLCGIAMDSSYPTA
ncbi:hypothetical protein ACOSP7_002240 [Xanthoceras sorbifolium]|uniref:Uncharacterized protein n=1 Tax=Xanthoceras sorbifolium TaxID=99658 RepID=A0ABQ8IK06_9ROSI|nr:hypothetical protein JRO89_XS01G0194700 [Xanthoceras sorbifolium]